MSDSKIEDLLAALTIEEKVALMTGRDMWTTNPIQRLGVPSIKVTDGPNGARGDGLLGTGTRTLCIPCGSALGATFNPALVERLGEALGEQARTKRSSVLLAPTINIHRSPLGGRNFECYSEDPFLSGSTAAAFVRGVQSQGVATTPKHFVANDAEFERNTINSIVSERALREIYLRPFEMAIKQGGAWGLMGSYNRVNGTFACEHERLLNTVLRDEWGFDGVVVTDWFAARSTAASANGGLDLEMPGPGRWWGDKLVDAVRADDVDESTIDVHVRRLLRLMARTGLLADGEQTGGEESIDDPRHRGLAREAAVESTVLLRNNGVLPLDPATVSTLAVIGPNASTPMMMGGGSAALTAMHETAPLDAIEARLGDRIDVRHVLGVDTARSTPALGGRGTASSSGEGWDIVYFAGTEFAGEPTGQVTSRAGRFMHFGSSRHVPDPTDYSFRATTTFTPAYDGAHVFTMVQAGQARLFVDGQLVIDGVSTDPGRGEAFFGLGSAEMAAEVELVAGRSIEVVCEYDAGGAVLLSGAEVGLRTPETVDLQSEAVAVAAGCDAAIVIVGTNDDWETEGRDRDFLGLPPGTDELISAVAAVNDRTLVVVNAGSPVSMPWIDDVDAVLDVWFGGQEMGDALVDVLTGERDPSGRLPMTFPKRIEDNPSFLNFPGESGEVRYGEDVFAGYRFYDARDIEPLFPFGFGLSYTSFDYGEPRVVEEGGRVRVTVEVTNAGQRAGTEVVQVYVAPPPAPFARPPRELKGIAKVSLGPGASEEVAVELDDRALQYFDPGDPLHASLAGNSPVPTGGDGIGHRADAGWITDAGTYRIAVGSSSRDIRGEVELVVTEERFEAP